VLLLVALPAAAGAQPLLERAVATRGRAPHAVILHAEARVYAGVPGRWRFTRAWLAPDRYAWRIETAGEPDSYLFDGRVVRAFIGSDEVASDAGPDAPLRSHARWTALTLLIGLDTAGTMVTELPASELPADVAAGLRLRFADGATYRLGFDRQARLLWAAGPLDLWPIASGPASVRYADHRRVNGVLLPFTATYFAGDKRLAVESITAACIDPPDLTKAAFTAPGSLPAACGGDEGSKTKDQGDPR
jgi:hypothetical protein